MFDIVCNISGCGIWAFISQIKSNETPICTYLGKMHITCCKWIWTIHLHLWTDGMLTNTCSLCGCSFLF